MKKELYHFIKEIIPVIVGILIALFINNWNEERKEKKYVQKMLNSIQAELIESKSSIVENMPLQEKLLDSLNFYKSDEKYSVYDIIKKAKGVYTPSIKTNSWVALSQNKIELIEYDKISQLSEIEQARDMYMHKVNYLMNLLYSKSMEKSEATKNQIILIITEIISTENSIIGAIEEFEK